METIIAEIFIPATNKTFDFALPAQGRIADVAGRIIESLESVERNIAFDATCPLICDLDHGAVLQPGMTVVQAGIRDGTRLMLL